MKYPLVLHTDNGCDFGVTVPDLPGCFSAGNSVEEAIENAREAILCHAEGMILDNETVPLPSEIVDLSRFNPDVGTALIAYADVDIEAIRGPVKRINITVRQEPAIGMGIDLLFADFFDQASLGQLACEMLG